MLQDAELLKRITVNPSIMGGKPVIRGLRFTVEQVLRWIAGGTSERDLLDEFPFLEPEDIQAALIYAGLVSSKSRLEGAAVAAAAEREDALIG
jgi:uncharacterized protein (DUF433 family)